MATSNNPNLADFVDQIERIDAEKQELSEERAVWLQQAESAGFPKAIVRKVVARRKKARNEVLEEDALVRAFEEDLGMLIR